MADLHDTDLPLVSNVYDILVKHYLFDFSCDFLKRCFTCSLVLFLEPVINAGNDLANCKCNSCDKEESAFVTETYLNDRNPPKNVFVLVLDCHKITVENVEEMDITFSEQDSFKYAQYRPSKFCSKGKLNFVTDKWSLKIWKTTSTCKFCFPRFIRISYETLPEGPSLLWVTDQDKNAAVFTYGAWINNRSLFPCQEPPSAMATWEASVSVDTPAIVLMSGDEEACTKIENGKTVYYYFTRNILPLSTLCLAVGFWQEHRIISKHKISPRCRIFAPLSLIDKSVQELFEYAPYCLLVSDGIFGAYPFPRIDFLIVPPTFGSLGMASPNIVFLSQSLLSGDSSMCSRVAHEIAHGWFGLLIGALDWTEEWLSEGFATFVEDYLHARTVNMSEEESKDYIEVKTYIRLKTLLQEISNTDEDLQILRVSKGETMIKTVDGVNAAMLKNGQNPIKAFIQVHYIKGYFLLKHLSNLVGIENFLTFLKTYIAKYRGKLVTSKDFLTYFYTCFPEVESQLTMEEIYENWLHNPGIADELKNMKPSLTNRLHEKAMREAHKWQIRNSVYLKRKSKRKKFDFEMFESLSSEQQILLLESMLEVARMSLRTLNDLNTFFDFSVANAEVQHRWFELVVKHKYKQGYGGLKQFLTDHLAMGVYLFSEMIFSGDAALRTLAEERYSALKKDMEPNYLSTIDQMFQDAE